MHESSSNKYMWTNISYRLDYLSQNETVRIPPSGVSSIGLQVLEHPLSSDKLQQCI